MVLSGTPASAIFAAAVCLRSFTRTQLQDWPRAEQILREGLAVDQVRDRLDMLEWLADVCEE